MMIGIVRNVTSGHAAPSRPTMIWPKIPARSSIASDDDRHGRGERAPTAGGGGASPFAASIEARMLVSRPSSRSLAP